MAGRAELELRAQIETLRWHVENPRDAQGRGRKALRPVHDFERAADLPKLSDPLTDAEVAELAAAGDEPGDAL